MSDRSGGSIEAGSMWAGYAPGTQADRKVSARPKRMGNGNPACEVCGRPARDGQCERCASVWERRKKGGVESERPLNPDNDLW